MGCVPHESPGVPSAPTETKEIRRPPGCGVLFGRNRRHDDVGGDVGGDGDGCGVGGGDGVGGREGGADGGGGRCNGGRRGRRRRGLVQREEPGDDAGLQKIHVCGMGAPVRATANTLRLLRNDRGPVTARTIGSKENLSTKKLHMG